MRHHIHSQKLGGVIATSKVEALVDAFTGQSTYQSSDLIKNNTCTLIPPTMGLDITKKHQLDMMACTYPYDAVNNTNMLPIDCRNDQNNLVQNNRDAILNSFNLRYPLLQLHFNNHDSAHHPS